MSLENTDSTSERIDHSSNQFSNSSKPTPFISNSPPPFLEEQDTSSVEEDKLNSNSVGNFQRQTDSDELNLSSGSLPKLRAQSPKEDDIQPENKAEVLKSLDEEWDTDKIDNQNEPETVINNTVFDPFQTQNNHGDIFFSNNSDGIAFENSEDTSNWADFGHEETVINQNDNNNFFSEDPFKNMSSDNTETSIQAFKVENINNNNNNSNQKEAEEDDGFGNFVELETVKIPVDQSNNRLPSSIDNKSVENEFFTNFESFLENMFKIYPSNYSK